MNGPAKNGAKIDVAKIGDTLHRRLFGLMSALPGQASTGLLRRYFEWWHRRPDPWGHAVLDYELQKYRTTLAQVPASASRPRRILDVGCSEGTFTHQLAEAYPAAEILGVDISARALQRARRQASGNSRLSFIALDIVTDSPAGRFDLIFCAETLYYLGRGERARRASERLAALLEPGGLLVLVHPWPEARALYQSLDADPALARLAEYVADDPTRAYAVTSYQRRPASGPATCGALGA